MFNVKFIIVIIINMMFVTHAIARTNSNIKILDKINVPDNIIFFDAENKQYSLDQFEGKTILLVFWATWCNSCKQTMNDLDILQKDFRKLPFQILPISEDYQGTDILKEYYKQYEIRYLNIFYDHKNELFNSMFIVGLPTAILIDKDGRTILSFIGYIDWYDEEIRNTLLNHIDSKNIVPKNSSNNGSIKINNPINIDEQKNIENNEIDNDNLIELDTNLINIMKQNPEILKPSSKKQKRKF